VLVTQKFETIGEMSCNPSMGGIGKGTLIREIDALGGLMGELADQSAIQFKVLNQSKGAAVQGPRAQIDRDQYLRKMQEMFTTKKPENLNVHLGSVFDLIIENGECKGLVLEDGTRLRSEAVVITAGTFLKGKCYIGKDEVVPAGRHLRLQPGYEAASIGLAESLERFGFPKARLKTGTPPRLDGRTIDYSQLQVERGDSDI